MLIAKYYTYMCRNNICALNFKVSKGTKIRNRYNQVSHLTQDTNGKIVKYKKVNV